ncbi:HicB family protein [Candidatus Poribacteria bacterium]|nr:MAG: HicB family protein [Candidatus Poribacteria bacterium]
MRFVEELPGANTRIEFTEVFQKVPEGYIGFVEELPGANTQGRTLEEARANLQEAIEMTLEANRILAEESIASIQDVISEPVFVEI